MPALLVGLFLLGLGAIAHADDAGPPFGDLPLVDEVRCAEAPGPRPFAEHPAGASHVTSLLGRPCRALPDDGEASFLAYRLGQGKNLQPGTTYVLALDYPEDQPRTFFIQNRGCETNLGFATGIATGDVVKGRYVHLNPESVQYPLSGGIETWRMLFTLHDRFPDLQQPRGEGPRPMLPADGFWVIVAQPAGVKRLRSAGAAVSRIRLYAVPDAERLALKLRLPPEGLPRRHLFWREEMSDGVVQSRDETKRGVKDDVAWFEYRARTMRFLGFNTFCTDLLEFGHNQGWDSAPYGGNEWVNQTPVPQRWDQVLDRLRERGYDFEVLPYYEYAGSVGGKSLGVQRRCRPLGKTPAYTHITWSEIANADVTDPETLEDVKKVLELTIVRHREQAKFLGAWFRTRPSHMPISFADSALIRFAVEASNRLIATREDLQADAALRQRYYDWWFGKRRQFLMAIRDYLRAQGVPEAIVLFTPEAAEGGPTLPGQQLVTDDPAGWQAAVAAQEDLKGLKVTPLADAIGSGAHLQAVLAPPFTWGEWEWQHSLPQADPQHYADTDGVLLTYPFNRLYTVSSPAAFDAFRTPSGLAVIHHYGLNENELEDTTGYFVTDVERAGPYCMLAEARAMAYGNPAYLGFLSSNTFNRGFPQYVRSFTANFLALPALTGEIVPNAASAADVVVRAIPAAEHGTYLAIVNTGLAPLERVRVKLPVRGQVTAAATGEPVAMQDGAVQLALYPGELRALHVVAQ